ncbi:MAG TPA: DMT family transporter [Gemmatimonadaceae bacterium]|nr:DMT family transporter [Gemmatimonadaceae bacterium]
MTHQPIRAVPPADAGAPPREPPREPPAFAVDLQLRVAPADAHGHGLTDLLLVAMAVIWGVNFSVVKFGTEVVPPLAFNAARMLLASVALGGLVLASRRRATRRDVVALLLLGVLGNGVYQYLFVQGVALTRAGNAALVLAATPAFVALIGRVRGVERIGARGALGIALSIAGIGLIVLSTSRTHLGGASVGGDLLVLGACVAWALYTVLLKPYTERVDGVLLSAVTMVGGTVPLTLLAVPALIAAPWATLGWAGTGAVVYSGLGALVLAYLFWYRGVRTLGPTRTAMYSNLQPVIALLVAWAFLAETPAPFQLLGAVLILAGLLLTRRAG